MGARRSPGWPWGTSRSCGALPAAGGPGGGGLGGRQSGFPASRPAGRGGGAVARVALGHLEELRAAAGGGTSSGVGTADGDEPGEPALVVLAGPGPEGVAALVAARLPRGG